MKYEDYERAFSPERLSKYSYACNADKTKALILYKHNIRLCQKFYGHTELIEYIHFLGYNKDELLFGFDVLPDTIINKITLL